MAFEGLKTKLKGSKKPPAIESEDPETPVDSPAGSSTHTDASGKTSYYSLPSKYTTPGYEWASSAKGYDWTSRQAHYGYNNPTMGEAYRKNLQARDEHVAAVHAKVQKLKEKAIEEKEPGLKIGYMYRA